MKTVYDFIASEIMDVIERDRRINKDDLIVAAEMGMRKHAAATEQAAKDNRLAMQACADTKRALAQAKHSEDVKRDFYGKSLKQLIDDQVEAIQNRDTIEKLHADSLAGLANFPATTDVVGIDPANYANYYYYTVSAPAKGGNTGFYTKKFTGELDPCGAPKPEDFFQTDAGLCILTAGRVRSRKSRMTE